MVIRCKPLILAMLIASTLCNSALASPTLGNDTLPEMGVAASGTLSVAQEIAMGDFYLRQLRGSVPLIYDPLLLNYINNLGHKLVKHANSVRTPFEFQLVNNPELNAFAFFGGNVVIHSGLIKNSDTESELASVMAHEIAHVTQRHLARRLEMQADNAPLTWAAALGSVLLAIANPAAGMAALSGTLAGSIQSVLTFTQSNEQEADRFGAQMLQRAGFDPKGMSSFMLKLADQARYMSKPPEILLTHPLPDSRLADVRNRVNQMPAQVVAPSLDFYLAKVRLAVLYGNMKKAPLDDYLASLGTKNSAAKTATVYGHALAANHQGNQSQARILLQPLLDKAPNNPWYLDLMTDIDIQQGKATQGISRLERALTKDKKNPVLLLNLANAQINAGNYAQASRQLYRYTYDHKNDINGWQLFVESSIKQKNRHQELAARAEIMALTGRIDQAIRQLSDASKRLEVGSMDQLRYDARIDQLIKLSNFYQRFK